MNFKSALCITLLVSSMCSYAEDEADNSEEKQQTQSEQITNEQQKKSEKPAIKQEVSFEEYISNLYEKKFNILREEWLKNPYTKEVNGITYLEFEGHKKKTKGHLFIFPAWNDVSRTVQFAKIASANNYDAFVFLPLPEIHTKSPYEEDNTNIKTIAEKYFSYVDTALNTLGNHERSNLIMFSGNTAGWILPRLQETREFKPDGIFLLDAFYKDKDSNELLAEQFSEFNGFTLDVITTNSNNWLNEAYSQRKLTFMKKEKPAFLNKTIKSEDLEELNSRFNRYIKKTDFTILQKKRRRK